MGLPTEYQTFIHLSRYSRWLDEDNRRETWEETITRLVNYFKYHIETNLEISLIRINMGNSPLKADYHKRLSL